MLLARLLHFLRGYLVINVSGHFPERFLNVCARRGILLWNVFSPSSSSLRCCISRRAFLGLAPIARKTGVRVKILKKCGLPAILARHKKRKWFAFSAAICLLCIIIFNQFVFSIEIEGENRLREKDIKEALTRCGLKPGAFRPHIDENQIKRDMMLLMPDLAWIWADMSGSRVIVTVKEKVPAPELFDKDSYHNLVAAKDGVIDSMIVRYGTPLVASGDTVKAGDILVSGLLVSEKGMPPRTVQADGEIYARVWYEKTKAVLLFQSVRHDTGETETKRSLTIFGKTIPFYKNELPAFSTYREESKERSLSLFGKNLGVTLSQKTYIEEVQSFETLAEESAKNAAVLSILSEFDEACAPKSYRKDYSESVTRLDEDTIEVTVIAEYIENIAQKTEKLSAE